MSFASPKNYGGASLQCVILNGHLRRVGDFNRFGGEAISNLLLISLGNGFLFASFLFYTLQVSVLGLEWHVCLSIL